MNFKKWAIVVCAFFLPICLDMETSNVKAVGIHAPTQARPDQPKLQKIGKITAEELKGKLAKNEPVMIIDLRVFNSTYYDTNKIKGSIHVKERRLQARLAFSPFKDLPRDRLIVTYCACPKDEISIRAAQILLEAGIKGARVLKGGWQAWLKAGGQVEAEPKV